MTSTSRVAHPAHFCSRSLILLFMVLYGPISMIICNAVHAAPVLTAVHLDLAHFGWLSPSFVHPAHLWSLRPIPLPTSSHQDVYLAGNSSSVCTTPYDPCSPSCLPFSSRLLSITATPSFGSPRNGATLWVCAQTTAAVNQMEREVHCRREICQRDIQKRHAKYKITHCSFQS
ncbi:hypothetical protein B0H11DRAFT_53248 [Mycena galericulata]|nr:hypothetical protein B0H11DRAFT_53248 [Mycena galericulata]